jgi:RNA polymerase sigma-70 factor (ECF subfamily)
MKASDLALLMAEAQRGEPAAYRRLLQHVQPWLFRYFRRRLPCSMVEDAVQDTMLAVHCSRHTFDPRRPFGPWLAAVARHKMIDRLRTLGRASFEQIDVNLAVDDHHGAVVSATVIEAMLATLGRPQSQVIRLVKIDGLSVQEAALRSGQSASLVRVNIHRGIAKMGASLAG